MQEDELEYQKIERYFRGEMTEEEHAAFEDAMEKDPDLKERVTIHSTIDALEDEEKWMTFEGAPELLKKEADLFRSEDTLQFSEKLKAFRNQTSVSETTSKSPWFNKSLWGAIAAILIIAIFVFYPKDPNLNTLFEEYHNWEDLPSLVTKGGDPNDPARLESLFRSKDYEGVIASSESLEIAVEGSYAQALLYVGAAHIELGNYRQALATFDRLINSNSLDAHKGYWYKALTYLKQENKEQCLEVLDIIAAEPTYFMHEDAKQLLKELR
ncbi:tetratricopeptide repeat protein [Aureisphaera galaxeae]|uniref:tetratricopeptide repeat protein n=1 Tax=Aureisphaera galaxeae TaxID=1538023 RepID=UPI002350E475|nr:tetratricopeptide repeat protein [Aureisphaera galaxeae]MDC8002457.1 tetratricopeptide repeat protein [Aureisphaera galaxeae]